MAPTVLSLAELVAPVFLVIGIGYIIRRMGWLTAEADASLMRVIVNLLFPCLILDTILGNQALEKAGNVLLAPAVGFGTVVLGLGLSYWTAPAFGIRDDRQRRTFALTCGLYNYGYVPLPLIQRLFDPQTTAVLFIHNMGVEIALWTAGVGLIMGAGRAKADESGVLKRILSPPLLAIVAAMGLHFAGARYWLSSIGLSAIHNMGSAAIPLGLILTGATFADQMKNLNVANGAALSGASVLLRLGVIPLVMLVAARYLPCPEELRRVLVIQSAMPSAVIPVLLSTHYGGDAGAAMRIVLITSALSLITIPIWIQFGLWWTQRC
jgi:predicted permease